jgi:biopolymer transport protein ExbD
MRIAWMLCLVLVACSSKPEPPSTNPTPAGSTAASPPSAAGPLARPATITTTIDLPQVARHGYVPLADDTRVIVSATPHGLVVDGKPITSIANGAVMPDEKEGGSLGLKIVRLTKFLEQQLSSARQPTPDTYTTDPAEPKLGLLLDKQHPYRLLMEIVFSTKAAGARRFDFVAKHGEELVAVPITLPVKARAQGADDLGNQLDNVRLGREAGGAPRAGSAVTAPDPQMLVSVTKTQLVLWSVSGAEGTLKQPKLAVPLASKTAFAELGKALAEIVARRWPDGKRAPDGRQIIVQADGVIPMQTIAQVLGAVRATPDNEELFPEILLSAGFE